MSPNNEHRDDLEDEDMETTGDKNSLNQSNPGSSAHDGGNQSTDGSLDDSYIPRIHMPEWNIWRSYVDCYTGWIINFSLTKLNHKSLKLH